MHRLTCMRANRGVCKSKERPSWFGRGSGKIFSERGECWEQVFSEGKVVDVSRKDEGGGT